MPDAVHAFRSLVLAPLAVLAGCHDAAPAAPVAPAERPALYFEPDTARVRLGESYRLQIRTRGQRSLRDIQIWVDGGDAVTVDGIGVITAMHTGLATVRLNATADGVSASAQAHVVVVGLSIVPWYNGPYGVGARVPLTWHVYSNTAGGGDQRVRWRSSDSAVVAVSDLGLLDARAPGSATLTAVALADSAIRASLPVSVVR